MRSYRFNLHCPWCECAMDHVTAGQHTSFDTRAVALCPECGVRWLINVELIAVTERGRSSRSPAKMASLQRARDASAAARSKVSA